MPDIEEPPIQQLAYAQAAEMLGVHEITLMRMVRHGDLVTKGKWARMGLLWSDVERLSLERWRPGRVTWLTASQVAEQLGLSRARINQLTDAGVLNYSRNPEGRRLYRPSRIAVMARARRVRLQRRGR